MDRRSEEELVLLVGELMKDIRNADRIEAVAKVSIWY
jgi:hypothetical protein